MYYFDHCATTPLHKKVIEVMQRAESDYFGNPSSTHKWGQKSRSIIETARSQMADSIGCSPYEIIFTGGGILRKEILSLQKIFIHVHPGIIPEYRGSTCFYYSLLNNYSLGATAYIMNNKIDAGEIILQRNFTLNYLLNNDQFYFLDHVLDNFIRSQVLKKIIQLFKNKSHFNTVTEDCSGFAYYIMHPLLRHLTIEKIKV